MRWRWAIPAAVGAYLVLGALLIAQRPGLYDDEAMMAAGAVHLLRSPDEFNLPHAPGSWICGFHHCLPLMAESRYMGAVKDYLCLPLFAMFGPRAAIIRLVSLILGAIGIAGMAVLVARQAGPPVAAASALLLALNPSYANTVVFDNGAVAVMMASFGLLCAALAGYLARRSPAAAFWAGAAAGFGIWARANFFWLLAAGGAAALIVFGRRALPPVSHWVRIAAGGIVGGLPFLAYQIVSRGGTWEALGLFTTDQPFRQLLRYRLFLLADTLLSDGEHRRMWDPASAMPAWQLWLFPMLIAAACVVCIAMGGRRRDWSFTQFAALSCVFLAGFLVFSRLEVAEHHVIAIVPLAALTAALAGSLLQAKHRAAGVVAATLAVVYTGSALYWHAAAIRGLRDTGGVGLWSSAVVDLARYVNQELPGRQVKILDWGFENNVFVLTGGRFRSKDLFWGASEQRSGDQQPWAEEIREGGIFLAGGPEALETPAFSPAFLRALAEARPVFKQHIVKQRNGSMFAQIIEIEPGTAESPPHLELTGFYSVESGGWRWTGPRFSVRLSSADSVAMRLYIPDANIQKLGPITLSARIGEHALAPQTYQRPGEYTFARKLNQDWLKQTSGWVSFAVDKWIPAGPADQRDLGVVVLDVSAP